MIEQIKENLEFSELWWNSATEGEQLAQDEIDCVKELNSAIRYLIGEVERLKKIEEHAINRIKAETRGNYELSNQVGELQRELAKYREDENRPRFKMDAQGNLTLVEGE